MAAGRHGGYRENEFRERESSFELPRKDFATAKEDYERIRNGNPDVERGQVRDLRDKIRVRQKDSKEGNGANGGYRASSSRSDSSNSSGRVVSRGPKPCGFSLRALDREPGELSSESGSDDAIESAAQIKENIVPKVVENGAQSPKERKRKFSPIVWDRDDQGVSNPSKNRIPTVAAALPPQPPLSRVQYQSPNVISDNSVQISSAKIDQVENLQSSSPVKAPVGSGSVSNGVSESPLGISSPNQKSGDDHGDDHEAEQLGDEECVPTRNISSSRWAAGNNSPGDEGEILENKEMPKRRKKIPLVGSVEDRVQNNSLTPESGELKRDESERARGQSSESDEGDAHARSSSRDVYQDNDSERDDYMDTDKDLGNNDSSVSQSETDSDDDNHSRETAEPAAPPQRSVNMLQGCRSVDEFERLNKIDEGTYGVVYRAMDKKTKEIVALKKVKMEKEREGFPLTSLREINILLSLHHPSIVDVKEVVVGSNLDSIFMVMEYMEHDLKALMETKKQPFSQSEVKCLMLQLLAGVKYLHDNWVLHRDLKTSNLLMNNRGELKICDFGLARQYGSPLKPYTHLVVTLWYRAPELLLGAKEYSTAIDMWSLGCIMAELLSKEPLFNGKTEFDQLDKIFKILGTPNETIWPGYSKLPGVKVNFVKHPYNLLRKKFPATAFTGSPVLSDAGFNLLNRLLTYDPEERITAGDALNHEWFREVPLPTTKEFMPTFPAQHAQDRRTRRVLKSPDPLEEQRRKELQQGQIGTGGVFG
ncbi:LOW QUALITY PROTEIN: cyclin-dependent kinase G-2-like [Pyrus x bretschneideri]|uniref:LOW QUALITY PROTEIN: cyclin-dependent kinase G-2-like n=1 Tax=Pyrus x bretschneideri TaxID=225117 RepID=UPI00202DBF74|nr:LOW QUALITY PROTEIN: cyclin-dependent kinase G-2-like [Pyrus x bretschneideri]